MNFLSKTNPAHQRVLIRLDLDLPQSTDGQFDLTRMEGGLASIEFLWRAQAQSVTVIAHRGHNPNQDQSSSLTPIAELLYTHLLARPACVNTNEKELREWLTVRENLRFDPREEAGSAEFAKELAEDHDLFVNDAFATAHRKHTSITFLPKELSTVFGLQFEKEYHAFQQVLRAPVRPFLFILGGAKLETKLPLLEEMAKVADEILVGGKLAVEAQSGEMECSKLLTQKMQIAQITADTLDISPASIADFVGKIASAKTIVWNGPMGYYEDGVHVAGTQAVGEAIAHSTQQGAYSMIGGGDTEAALTVLELEKPGNFSHICSGGGAMMEYLAHGTLPAIKAVMNDTA